MKIKHKDNTMISRPASDESDSLNYNSNGTFSFLRISTVNTVSLESLLADNIEPDNELPLHLPPQIGYYKIENHIGEGGMGDIYQATHLLLKRTTAIKFIRRSKISPSALEQFAQEMEIAGKLSHPNLVNVYDAGEINGMPFLVMERLQGMTLSQYIQERGARSLEEAVRIIIQAANGLLCAHTAGLIHRDVKPGNLWISPLGEVKVLDLGLAKMRETSVEEGPEEKKISGTPDFIAPEQTNPLGIVDERADIYSLGCTLFYLLTGHAPFDDSDHRSIKQKLSAQLFEPLPRLTNSVSSRSSESIQHIQTVLDAMTAKEPSRRFGSMTEVIENLEKEIHPRSIFPPINAGFKWTGVVALCAISVFVLFALVRYTFPPAPKMETLVNLPTQTTELPTITVTQQTNQNVSEELNKEPQEKIATSHYSTEEEKQENEQSEKSTVQFSAGTTAGEKRFCVIDNIKYTFCWCPPGEFVMGTAKQDISDDLTFEQLLVIAEQFQMIFGFDLEEIQTNYQTGSEEKQRSQLQWLQNNLKKWATLFSQNPAHTVTLTHGFWLLETEVTTEMWMSIMGDFPHFGYPKNHEESYFWTGNEISPGHPQWPAVGMSWNDCQDFCDKLSQRIKVNVVLPTEAQWEYSALAGKKELYGISQKYVKAKNPGYPWNVKEGSLNPEVFFSKEKIFLRLPNAWGLYGMQGNVGEWCSDWYEESINIDSCSNPVGISSGEQKVVRDFPLAPFQTSNSFKYWEPMPPMILISPTFSWLRQHQKPDKISPYIGLRVCINVETTTPKR